MQALSRLLAHHGQAYWQDGRWEDATPRVAHGVAARVDRLKAIGNGQVPQCAAQAWRILTHNVELSAACLREPE
jgi:DNA (cytosine-5)-methyltransferase 1